MCTCVPCSRLDGLGCQCNYIAWLSLEFKPIGGCCLSWSLLWHWDPVCNINISNFVILFCTISFFLQIVISLMFNILFYHIRFLLFNCIIWYAWKWWMCHNILQCIIFYYVIVHYTLLYDIWFFYIVVNIHYLFLFHVFYSMIYQIMFHKSTLYYDMLWQIMFQ